MAKDDAKKAPKLQGQPTATVETPQEPSIPMPEATVPELEEVRVEVRAPETLAAPSVSPERAKAISTLEKINLLSDYANACRNENVLGAFKKLPNGERLLDIFVKAVSVEIETLMSPQQAQLPTQTLASATDYAQQTYVMLQRMGALMSALERGPGMLTLRTFIQKLGGGAIPEQPQQPEVEFMEIQHQQQPQPQQPQQRPPQRFVDNGGQSPEPQGRGRGGLGSW